MNYTGVILDQNDDSEKALIQRLFPGDVAPDLIKSSSVLPQDKLKSLPNEAFALCAIDNGQLLRKFAMVDPGMTATSVIYFLSTKDLLPLSAQKLAAANLVEGCRFHELEPPAPLVELAKGAKPEAMIDISGLSAPIKVAAPGEGVSLDSQEKVAAACDYFDENWKQMHPKARHEVAVNLMKSASVHDVETSDLLQRYGSSTYAPSLRMAYETRKALLELDDTDSRTLLDSMFDKAASVHPERFASALAEFDRGMGFDQYWDLTMGIPDPWFSTFGRTKVAEYVYVDGNDRVTATDLQRLAQNPLLLNEHFDEDIVKGFKNDPVTVFDSLPLPQKKVIMRVASDMHTGGTNHRHGGA